MALAVLITALASTASLVLAVVLELHGLRAQLFLSIATLGSFGLSLWVARRIGLREPEPGPTLAELEAAGRLTMTDYRAVRAFEIEEQEDEGLHFFLELDDGRVLFVSGQWLYDSTAYFEDDVTARFPCSAFTLVQDAELGVLDVRCAGRVFAPEVAFPSSVWDPWSEQVPACGILDEARYDALKASFAKKLMPRS